jgi:predicted nucleotidyltransferase
MDVLENVLKIRILVTGNTGSVPNGALGHRVDLVERDTLKPVIGKRILDEVIFV